MRNLPRSKKFALGVAGYHFQHVTEDSGAGATLGSFKGRTTALGPNLNVNFKIGQTPVSTQMHWCTEFDVNKRFKGNTCMITEAIPLAGSS